MSEGNPDPPKRKRLQGACDVCRRRKVRCDSADMPGNRCTNCITAQLQCTHDRLKPAENIQPPLPLFKTAQDYIENILSPSTIYVPPADPYSVLIQLAQYARSLEEQLAALQSQTLIQKPRYTSPWIENAGSPYMEALGSPMVSGELGLGAVINPLTTKANSPLFYGESSGVQFVKSAINHMHGSAVVVGQRPGFWTVQPWEEPILEAPPLVFPDNDLLEGLVKIYFDQINPVLGVLHSPSFRQTLADGLHFRDRDFGAVVLAVCSLASRYSDDPRVFLDGVNSEHSCGWKWFKQVRPLRASLSLRPSLPQLQLICFSVLYLAGTGTQTEECWLLSSLGLRYAQAAGAHHRSGYKHMKPLEAELYKRVFYVLLSCDTIISSFKGRPSLTQSADFDIDWPLDCDEEYWGIPNAVQPRGKPSTSSFLVAYGPLMKILERIQRNVYPVNGQLPSSETIAELDSELNKWVDTIPEHLRWDPNQENQIFLDQSAGLYASYYHAQILIHRPFIPAPGKESLANKSFPSLAICANAARSCGHVMDIQTRRGRGVLCLPQILTLLFDSAVVLLVNVWAIVGKSRTPERYNRATSDVQNCVRVLRLYERRWRVAGRKCDIISAMLNIGKFTSDAPSLKRSRDTVEMSTMTPALSEAPLVPPDDRPIAGTSRVMSVTQQIQALEVSIRETDHLFALPLHTEELGNLPIYDSFDYDFTFQPSDIQYQPQSHLDSQYYDGFGPMEPEFLSTRDSLSPPGSNFHTPQSGGTPAREHMHLDSSFDVPSGYGWRDWCTYLENVGGLDQDRFQ